MQRILILGCSGSGKSTLARRIGSQLGLQVVHLDQHYFHPNWVEKPKNEWEEIVSSLVAEDSWVMDGNYTRTLDLRLPRADMAIFLDFPTWFCLYRVLWRLVAQWGKVRQDSSPGCPERFDWKFIGYVLNYNGTRRGKIIDKLAKSDCQFVHLRSMREIDKFVTTLKFQ